MGGNKTQKMYYRIYFLSSGIDDHKKIKYSFYLLQTSLTDLASRAVRVQPNHLKHQNIHRMSVELKGLSYLLNMHHLQS